MPAEDKEVRVVSTREDTTEEYSFDALAKGLASGTISRRRALKLLGTAIVGAGVLTVIPAREAEAARCGDRAGCQQQCRRDTGNCRCVETITGNVRCVRPCCLPRACDTNEECRNGELCMTNGQGGGCCPQDEEPDKRGVCVRQCPQEPPPNNCRRQRF